MAKGGPFATFLIIGPTCFFLGILFSSFPYDYYVLWANPTSTSATSEIDYFSVLETHLKFIHASPPLISRILHIVIGTGLAGLMLKLYKPTEANMLFDGATLVLYMCGITVYIANIVKGLRVVTAGVYGVGFDDPSSPLYTDIDVAAGEKIPEVLDAGTAMVVGREDSLKVFAASNTILAVILVGVLILQAGQWYAQKKEMAELEEMDRVEREKRGGGGVGVAGGGGGSGGGGGAQGQQGSGGMAKGKGKVGGEEGKKKV